MAEVDDRHPHLPSRQFGHALVTIYEGLSSIPVEEITREALDATVKALRRLLEGDITQAEGLKMARELRSVRLRPIPLLTRAQRERALASLGIEIPEEDANGQADEVE